MPKANSTPPPQGGGSKKRDVPIKGMSKTKKFPSLAEMVAGAVENSTPRRSPSQQKPARLLDVIKRHVENKDLARAIEKDVEKEMSNSTSFSTLPDGSRMYKATFDKDAYHKQAIKETKERLSHYKDTVAKTKQSLHKKSKTETTPVKDDSKSKERGHHKSRSTKQSEIVGQVDLFDVPHSDSRKPQARHRSTSTGAKVLHTEGRSRSELRHHKHRSRSHSHHRSRRHKSRDHRHRRDKTDGSEKASKPLIDLTDELSSSGSGSSVLNASKATPSTKDGDNFKSLLNDKGQLMVPVIDKIGEKDIAKLVNHVVGISPSNSPFDWGEEVDNEISMQLDPAPPLGSNINLDGADTPPESKEGKAAEKGEDDAVSTVSSLSAAEYPPNSIWNQIEEDSEEVQQMKDAYRKQYEAELEKLEEDDLEGSAELMMKFQESFERELQVLMTNADNRREWYKDYFPKESVAITSPTKQGADVLSVAETYPGDDLETIHDDDVSIALDKIHKKWLDQIEKNKLLKKSSRVNWARFVTLQQDLALKTARSKLNRALTMKERHFFYLVRSNNPTREGATADIGDWLAVILSGWGESRGPGFQAYINKLKTIDIWTGVNYPPEFPETKEAPSSEETPIVVDPSAASMDVGGEEEERLSLHAGEEFTEDMDVDTTPKKAAVEEAPKVARPEIAQPLTEAEEKRVKGWLSAHGIRAKRPLHRLDQGRSGLVWAVNKSNRWAKFPAQRGATTQDTWFFLDTPNATGDNVRETSDLPQMVWVNITGKQVLFHMVGTRAVDSSLADNIMKYFSLPLIPTLQIRIDGEMMDPNTVKNIGSIDYWSQYDDTHQKKGKNPFEISNRENYYPPMAWKQLSERKSYRNVPTVPYGILDRKNNRPTDLSAFPKRNATLKDKLQGLCLYEIGSYTYKSGEKPVHRDIFGNYTSKAPFLWRGNLAPERVYGPQETVPKDQLSEECLKAVEKLSLP